MDHVERDQITWAVEGQWCAVCGADHSPKSRCPGQLQATGPEEQGWKINVQSSRGIEAYGVLLAPTGERWMARILTYPRVLWLVPGGATTLKFLARSREQAERKAADFIRHHCRERGFVMRDELTLAAVEASASTRTAQKNQPPRFHRNLPVRFGIERPTCDGVTKDLSEGGLFVVTDDPVHAEHLVGMLLHMEHMTVPLRGSVMWVRRVPGPGRPAGMGVRLHNPPRVYVNYVRALA